MEKVKIDVANCSESPQEVIEADIDEIHDALEVRSDFDASLTRDHFL